MFVEVISPQGVLPRLKGAFEHLGKSENVILANVVACAMGATVRPLITLSNPNEPPDEKRYAAFRECLNELTALVCCFAFGKGAEMAGNAFLKPAFSHLPEPVVKKKLQTAGALFSAVGTIGANLVIPQIGNRLVHPVKRLFHLNFDAGKTPQATSQPLTHTTSLSPVTQPALTTSSFRLNHVSSGMPPLRTGLTTPLQTQHRFGISSPYHLGALYSLNSPGALAAISTNAGGVRV